MTFLPLYGMPIVQYNLFLMPLYPFIMAYAIIRHGLLDSEEVLAIHRDKLALIGLMASSVNHEIKNPLFLLQEYVRKMKAAPEGGIPDKMSEQISRMSHLVDRLNDFAKPNAPSVEDVYLAKAIENALFFASRELQYQNIEVKLDLDPHLPNPRGNRGQFEEIFLNLIMNAYHAMSPPDSTRVGDDRSLSPLGSGAMPKGGKLMIEARTVSKNVGARRPRPNKEGWETQPLRTTSGAVVITISDTGHGIPKEDLKNIFKPFYTTKGKSGTGLGLHIVKTLVEQNGGKITVQSEVGKGTIFVLGFDT